MPAYEAPKVYSRCHMYCVALHSSLAKLLKIREPKVSYDPPAFGPFPSPAPWFQVPNNQPVLLFSLPFPWGPNAALPTPTPHWICGCLREGAANQSCRRAPGSCAHPSSDWISCPGLPPAWPCHIQPVSHFMNVSTGLEAKSIQDPMVTGSPTVRYRSWLVSEFYFGSEMCSCGVPCPKMESKRGASCMGAVKGTCWDCSSSFAAVLRKSVPKGGGCAECAHSVHSALLPHLVPSKLPETAPLYKELPALAGV